MIDEPRCAACNDSGWVPFLRTIGEGRDMPWAAACRCEKGMVLSSPRPGTKLIPDPVIVEPIDGELFDRRIDDAAESLNCHTSTPERRKAALAYIRASLGVDPEPITMVENILAGRRDDVVRSLLKESGSSDRTPGTPSRQSEEAPVSQTSQMSRSRGAEQPAVATPRLEGIAATTDSAQLPHRPGRLP